MTAVLGRLLHKKVTTERMAGKGHLGAGIKTLPRETTPQATTAGLARTTVSLL